MRTKAKQDEKASVKTMLDIKGMIGELYANNSKALLDELKRIRKRYKLVKGVRAVAV